MKEILLDTILDAIKLLPFLFITFLFMEYLEHKMTNKSKKIIEKSGKFGPIIGGILGAFPQCGFSVIATNLFSARIITLGTLVSIYLSTSDEMIPILISENVPVTFILKVLLVKVIIGMLVGLIIDLFYTKSKKINISQLCDISACDCHNSLIKSTLKHTFNIFIFIFIVSLLLNIGMHAFGEDALSKIFLRDNMFSSFVTSLIGLIPNCGSSVIITKLYLNNMISLGGMIGALLTGAGVSYIVLFKANKNLKENIKIVLILYFVGSLFGLIFNLLQITL